MSSPSEPVAVAQAHDRALAELLFDLRQRGLQGLGLFGVERFDGCVHRGLLVGAEIMAVKLDVCTVPRSKIRLPGSRGQRQRRPGAA
jgi:hypothetical protein